MAPQRCLLPVFISLLLNILQSFGSTGDTANAISRENAYTEKAIAADSIPAEQKTIDSKRPNDAIRELDKITVEGGAKRIVNVADDVSKVSMDVEDIKNLPNVGEADVARSMQLQPGVCGANESSAGLAIRGSGASNTLVLMDGYTIYHADHFMGFFSPFNTNAISSTDLYKGGFPVEYGGRTSGVMVVKTKTADLNKFHAGIRTGLLASDCSVEIPFKKASLILLGRKSYTGFLESGLYKKIMGPLYKSKDKIPAMDSLYYDGSSTSFYDINSKASFMPGVKDTVVASLYMGRDYLLDSIDFTNIWGYRNKDAGGSTWKNLGLSAGWTRAWTDRWKSASIISYSDHAVDDFSRMYFIDLSTGILDLRAKQMQDAALKTTTFKITNEVIINTKNVLRFGAEFESNNALVEGSFKERDSSENFIEIVPHSKAQSAVQQFCGFLQEKFSPVKWLTLTPGARCTYYSGVKKDNWFWDLRCNMLVRCTDAFLLKGSVGTYHQFILQASNMVGGVYTGYNPFWFPADDNSLPVTKAFQAILGGTVSLKGFLFDVEGYIKQIHGYVGTPVIINAFTLSAENSNDFKDYNGDGRIYGIDFLLSKTIGLYTGWIGYTLSKSMDRYYLINAGEWYPSPDDRRHELKWINMLSWKGLNVSATWIYATGKPYTETLKNININTNNSLFTLDVPFTLYSKKNALRLTDYHRLDLAVSYDFKFANRFHPRMEISVFNVYNRNNMWRKSFWRNPEGFQGVFENDIYYMGITPSLAISFNF